MEKIERGQYNSFPITHGRGMDIALGLQFGARNSSSGQALQECTIDLHIIWRILMSAIKRITKFDQ